MKDLERLVAVHQIRDLMARYARYADGNPDAVIGDIRATFRGLR